MTVERACPFSNGTCNRRGCANRGSCDAQWSADNATRYVWLRAHAKEGRTETTQALFWNHPSRRDFDAAVDRAMAEAQPAHAVSVDKPAGSSQEQSGESGITTNTGVKP